MNVNGVELERLNHDCFLIKHNGKVIYIDPFRIEGGTPADIILISHEHFDHCSIEDVQKIIKPETMIAAPPNCQSKLSGMKFKDLVLVEPNKQYDIIGIKIKTVHAYNMNKFMSEGIPFHPKQDGGVGYILNLDGKRVYHMGDTDQIPELKNVQNIDIALVPVSGTYVMTVDEAAAAIKDFNPKVAVPMHYGEIVGTEEDAKKFKEIASCEVVIV